MANNIEWGEISAAEPALFPAGEFSDPFGNQNDDWAMSFGDGIVLEGSLDAWQTFAEKLLEVIADARKIEDEYEEDER